MSLPPSAPALSTTGPEQISQSAPPRRADFPQRAKVLGQHSGQNFSLAHVGKFAELARYGVTHPALKKTIPGKVFLHEVLGLTGMVIWFNPLPPHTTLPFYHKHKQNEEVYLILSGSGQYQVDGETMEIAEGTAVRVAPNGVRCIRNTAEIEMFFLCIQAKEGSLEQWTGTDGVGVPDAVQWPENIPA